MKNYNSLSVITLGLLVLCGGFFATDYMLNNANTSADANQASVLNLEVGSKDVDEKEVISVNTEAFRDTQNEDIVDPNVNFEFNGLIEKDIFSPEFLTENDFTLEDIKHTSKLFEFFDIEEIKNNPLKKQILKSGDQTVVYIYRFPSESYALGLDYDVLTAQIKPIVSDSYKFTEPSTFSEKSFYIVSNDGAGNVNSVAQIGNTLVGLEYEKENYAKLQSLIENLEIQEK